MARPEQGLDAARASVAPPPAVKREGFATAAEWSALSRRPDRSDHDVRRKRPPLLSFLLRMGTLRRLAAVVSLLAIDFGGVSLAILTALMLKAEGMVLLGNVAHVSLGDELHETGRYLAFAYLLTVLLFWRSGLYASRSQRPGLTRIVGSLFQVALVALIFAEVSGEHFRSFYVFWGSLTFGLLYVPAFRHLYERVTGWLLRAAGYNRRTVLVGTNKQVADVARALRATARAGSARSPVEVVGYLSPEPTLIDEGVRMLGGLGDLTDVLESERVDEVIIADPEFPQADAVGLVDLCHGRGVRVCIAPSTMEILISRAEFVPGESVPLFELGPPVFEGIDFAVKRAFDVVVASVALVLLSPLLALMALAIRVTSRGPILFRSIRPGIGQRPFSCLKFRTMYADAEARQGELDKLNEASGALFKIRDDPRLTSVGRLLRRFSLDELPQLVNVIRGDMSLVGPRPLPERDFQLLADWHRKRYLVLPGMTGLWQVSGRSELGFDDLVRLDFIYLERWSLALDLAILAKTIPAVLARRGAY